MVEPGSDRPAATWSRPWQSPTIPDHATDLGEGMHRLCPPYPAQQEARRALHDKKAGVTAGLGSWSRVRFYEPSSIFTSGPLSTFTSA